MNREPSSGPWWKYGHVWLVVAGPAVVVVAALVTAWIAASSPDPVLTDERYKRSIEAHKVAESERALVPALQGRNHAATPPAH